MDLSPLVQWHITKSQNSRRDDIAGLLTRKLSRTLLFRESLSLERR